MAVLVEKGINRSSSIMGKNFQLKIQTESNWSSEVQFRFLHCLPLLHVSGKWQISADLANWNHKGLGFIFQLACGIAISTLSTLLCSEVSVWQDHHHHTKRHHWDRWLEQHQLPSASHASLQTFQRNRTAAWPEVLHLSSALRTGLLPSASLKMPPSDSFMLKKIFPFKLNVLSQGLFHPLHGRCCCKPLPSQWSCSAPSGPTASCITCLLNLGGHILMCTCLFRHHSNHLPPFTLPNLLLSSSPAI